MAIGEEWHERIPQPGETCVFSESEEKWRRDALMFDRVYAPLKTRYGMVAVLSSIANPAEMSEDRLPNLPLEFSFGSVSIEDKICREASPAGAGAAMGFDTDDFWLIAEQTQEWCYAERGTMGTWCTSRGGLYFKRFGQGELVAYEGALNNLPVVQPDVSWDEVKSFREDAESVRKYRDLRLWLGQGLQAQSEQHATDLIAQKIEDYRWAINKHGLQTVIGSFANLWGWKEAAGLAVGVGTAATLGSAVVGALIAGLAVTSGIGAYFAERKITEKDVRRGPGREVAILVDIQDRFSSADH